MQAWTRPPADTWVELLTYWATHNPDGVAVRFLANGEDETEVLTYRQLHEKAISIAASIQPLAEKGSRAVILLPNNVSFITTFFGCLYAGVIAVPGYPPRANRNKDRITKMLKQCGGRLIIGDSNVDRNEIMGNLANLGFRGVRFLDYSAVEGGSGAAWTDPRVKGDDIAFIQYTSGSTNDPKGVCLTHDNLLSNMVMLQKAFGLNARSQLVSWLPLYHDMGLIGGLMLGVYVGFPFTFMPPASFVQKPLRWLKAITKYGGTMAGGPNFAWDLCVNRFKEEDCREIDLSSLETFFNGAEPIRASSMRAFASTYAKHGIKPTMFFPCYGLAEGSLYVSGAQFGKGYVTVEVSKAALQKGRIEFSGEELVELTSSGESAEGLDVLIVNPDTMTECPANEVGEIWVNGGSVSSGYWDNEDENRATFGVAVSGRGHHPSGYLRTGDLGFFHQDQLFVTGRIKDVIIVGGRNHYPQDLELTAQNAAGAAAIAAAFTVGDLEPINLVIEVHRTGMKADFASEAVKIAQAIGTEHELMVSRIVFVRPGDLPRTSSGKVQRRLTRKKMIGGEFAAVYDWNPDSNASGTPADSARPKPELVVAVNEVFDPVVQPLKDFIREYAQRRINFNVAHQRKGFPPQMILDFGNRGLFGMLIPRPFGGLGLTKNQFAAVIEQLAAVDLSLAIFVGLNNTLGIQPILDGASGALKTEVLPGLAHGRALAGFAITETGAGSNPKAIVSRATTVKGGAVVDGEKIWIGLASWASHITVFAKEVDDQGKSIGISAFLVDPNQAGVSFGPEAMTMGMQPIVQAPVRLAGVRVEDARRLGEPGKGLSVAYQTMNLARFGLVAVAIGAMKQCYQIAEAFASGRQINTGALVENGHVVQVMSEFIAAIEALETLTSYVGEMLDSGSVVREELFMVCKIIGPEALWSVVDRTMQLLGGRGYLESNHVPRIFRDARLLRIFEGPTETIAYHLGSVVLGQGVSSIASYLEEASGLGDRFRADVAKYKAVVETDTQPSRFQVVACAIGEMAAHAVMGGLQGSSAGSRRWLESRYHASVNRLEAHLQNGAASATEVSRAAAKYRHDVGFNVPLVPGEDWEQNFDVRTVPTQATTPPTAARDVPVPPRPEPAVRATPPVEKVAPPAAKVTPKVAVPSAAPAAPPADAKNTGDDAVRAFLRKKIVELKPAAAGRLTDDVPFATIGIDSISAVELVVAVDEAFGVQAPDTLAWDYPTIAKSSDYIASLMAKIPKVPKT